MTEIQCPYCKKPIYDEDALTCHFCGESLHRCSGGAFGAMNKAGMKWIIITLIIMVAVVMLASLF